MLTAQNASGEEDTRIPLAGLSAALADADGSETFALIRITGVPAGARLTDAAGATRGVDNGDGTWTLSAADLTGLHYVPPLHVHGAVDLTLEATSREASNGDTATSSIPFRVTVDAQADAPTAPNAAIVINEDATTTIGASATYALVDSDGFGSRHRGRDHRVSARGRRDARGVWRSGGRRHFRGYRITGPAAGIRATLDGLAVRAPANSDAEFSLAVAVTTTDADGSTATTTGTLSVAVAAVADAPVVSGSGAGGEDAYIATPIAVSLADADGSETLSSVVWSQVPSGASLRWNTGLAGSVVDNGDGSFTFTGATSEIQALLLSIEVRPPLHSDADFTLRVTRDCGREQPDGGQVATLNAVTVFDVPINVTALRTSRRSARRRRGERGFRDRLRNEHRLRAGGRGRSETVSQVTLSNFPTGSTVAYTAAGGAVVALNAGVYTITGGAADIRATLDSFTVTPAADSDANFTLNVAVTTTDTGGVTATRTGTHAVIVDAVADAPTGSGQRERLRGYGHPALDHDGCERPRRLRDDHAGAHLRRSDGGTLNWTNFAGATVTNPSAGVYEIAGAEAAIRNVLGTATVRPPLHSDAEFDLSVTVRATETNPTTSGEVALLNRDSTFTLPVNVTAVADQPTVGAATSRGNEDSAIVFGTNIAYALVDADGSETVVAGDAVELPDRIDGRLHGGRRSGRGAQRRRLYDHRRRAADIRATLDSFTVTPAADSDANFTLNVR